MKGRIAIGASFSSGTDTGNDSSCHDVLLFEAREPNHDARQLGIDVQTNT